jgi:proteasome lid subunit RPN8/RPN11
MRVVHLSDQLRRQIVDHCISQLPYEGCGLLAMEGDTVKAVYPTTNEALSSAFFTIPPAQHYEALVAAEEAGLRLGGVFHSHPGGQARPSPTDIEAALDPEWVHLLVGLAGAPSMRLWAITGGRVTEIHLS